MSDPEMAEASRKLRAWAVSRPTNGKRQKALSEVATTLNSDVRGVAVCPMEEGG